MFVNKMVDNTTRPTPTLNVGLVIGQTGFKIHRGSHTLQSTSHTLSKINDIGRGTVKCFPNIIQSTSNGGAK